MLISNSVEFKAKKIILSNKRNYYMGNGSLCHYVMILYVNFIMIKGSILQEISYSKCTYVKKQSCKIHKG